MSFKRGDLSELRCIKGEFKAKLKEAKELYKRKAEAVAEQHERSLECIKGDP